MSVSIDIVPLDRSICMYGEPDPFSAYSLSGHVTISLSSSFLRKQARVLLKSLELTFEGQSEVVAPSIGYSSLRLCRVTKELVPNEPVLLSDEGSDDTSSHCRWNAIFNLPIPGWLPETTNFGKDELGVSYRLYATAKYVDIESHKRCDSLSSSSSWSFNSLYSSFCSRERIAEAGAFIYVKRFIHLPSDEPRDASLKTYLINHPKGGRTGSGIPMEIMSTIQVLTSVPEYINVDDHSLTLTIRLRTKGLPAEECKRLQLSGFSVNVLQKDKCRASPSREFEARYPIPGPELQPPNLPLRLCHSASFLYCEAYSPPADPNAAFSRTFSLLPPEESGVYNLQNDNYVFANDADLTERPTWYTLQTNVPLMHVVDWDRECEWAGPALLRPTNRGPLLTVRHEILISLQLLYDLPGQAGRAKQLFTFSVPAKFVSVAPPLPKRSLSPPLVSSASSSTSDLSSTCSSSSSSSSSSASIALLNDKLGSIEPPPMLPPYSQLFYANGDRKIDPTPLPLYIPREEDDPCSAGSLFNSPVYGAAVDDISIGHGEQALPVSLPISVAQAPQSVNLDRKVSAVH